MEITIKHQIEKTNHTFSVVNPGTQRAQRTQRTIHGQQGYQAFGSRAKQFERWSGKKRNSKKIR